MRRLTIATQESGARLCEPGKTLVVDTFGQCLLRSPPLLVKNDFKFKNGVKNIQAMTQVCMKSNLHWRKQTCNLIYNFLSVASLKIGLFHGAGLGPLSTILTVCVCGGGGAFSNWNSFFKSNADLLKIKASANGRLQCSLQI